MGFRAQVRAQGGLGSGLARWLVLLGVQIEVLAWVGTVFLCSCISELNMVQRFESKA